MRRAHYLGRVSGGPLSGGGVSTPLRSVRFPADLDASAANEIARFAPKVITRAITIARTRFDDGVLNIGSSPM